MEVLVPTMKKCESDFCENTRLVCFLMAVKRPSLNLRQTATHNIIIDNHTTVQATGYRSGLGLTVKPLLPCAQLQIMGYIPPGGSHIKKRVLVGNFEKNP